MCVSFNMIVARNVSSCTRLAFAISGSSAYYTAGSENTASELCAECASN